MAKGYGLIFSILLSLILGITFLSGFSYAAVSDWQKAASITPKNSSDFSSESFKQSLRDLKATGANQVSFVIYYYQSDIKSSTLYSGSNTPSDVSLANAIKYAKSIGLNVSLKIHIDSQDGRWRGSIDPDNRSEWFKNYKNIVTKYAKIAADNGASQMVIGTELVHLSSDTYNSSNTGYWNDIISSVRNIFPGTLTYSAQWSGYGSSDSLDEKHTIGFWDKLDYMGISAYYPLAEYTANPTLEQLIEAWRDIDENELRKLSETNSLGILFTEIGFRSVTGANQETWNYWKDGSYDADLQSRLFEALFKYWQDKGYFEGINIWEWDSNPNEGGSGDESYTPQNKPAEKVITQYFGGSAVLPPDPGTNPNPTPVDPPNGTTYSVSGSASPAIPSASQTTTISYNVKSSYGLTGVVVDMEIYDSSGKQVFQKYMINQDFTANTPKIYTAEFSSKNPGEYVAKMGIFSIGWNKLYHWNNRVAVINVSSTQPPSTSYSISGSVNPESPDVNQSTQLTANVSSNNKVSGAIVDVEILDNDGNKIFQKYYTNQTIDTASKQFQTNWTPKNPGTYTLHVGVFNSNWTQKYHWANAIVTFEVGSNSANNSGNSEGDPNNLEDKTIKVWWPKENVKISGEQPFKAMLEGADADEYDIFWQVDGGDSTKMEGKDNHKEDIVDIDEWQDKDDDPYEVKFIAKDKNGKTISEKTVTVYTWIK